MCCLCAYCLGGKGAHHIPGKGENMAGGKLSQPDSLTPWELPGDWSKAIFYHVTYWTNQRGCKENSLICKFVV